VSSIRRQLTVSLCVLAAVLLPCGVAAVYLVAQRLLVAQFDATLEAKAEALISVAEIDDDEFEIDLDVQHFAGFGSPLSGDFFVVRRADGRIVARSPSLGREGYTFSTVPAEGSWRGEITLPEGGAGRAVAQPFAPADDRDQRFTDLQIVVAGNSAALLQTLRVLLFVLLATGAAGLGAAVLLIRLGLRRGLRPLDALAAEVTNLKIDASGMRLDTGVLPAELRGIGSKLNDLLERVERSIGRERRFSSHAAHELRTPLAELKMMAELIGKWPDEATPERSQEMLEVIRELEELLNKLSLLARTEAGAGPVQFEPVDLRTSVERAIDRETPAMAARGLQLRTSITPGDFRTDPVLWQAILANLVGNAVAHAPPGSTIGVEASPRAFSVTNPAPNLDEADLDFLFERFWRKNTARDGPHHSGLGLAIVQASAQLLGATCRATLTDGDLRITVDWPAQIPGPPIPEIRR
jgi:signal transduction histidine kinase